MSLLLPIKSKPQKDYTCMNKDIINSSLNYETSTTIHIGLGRNKTQATRYISN